MSAHISLNGTGKAITDGASVRFNLPRKLMYPPVRSGVDLGGVQVSGEACAYEILKDVDSKRLLEKASLFLTPYAWREGRLFSSKPTNSSNGTFSVTRATTATRVNAAGLVELVPYNLFTWSQGFENAAWNKQSTSITANNQTAPDGTLTADTMNVSATISNVSQTLSLVAGTYTASIWVKTINVTTAGNLRFSITIDGTLTSFTFTPTSTWTRFTQTFTAAVSVGVVQIVRGSGFVGDVAIWGAQLVEGTSALDYQMTETRLNIPRLDYSLGSCPNILLEPQRTNLVLRSEEFDNATWTRSAVTVTANATTSPNGTNNADLITTSATFNNIFQSITVTQNTTYTFTFWALQGSMTDLKYSVYNVTGVSNIVAPTSYYSQTNSSSWTRITVAFTTPAGCTQINIYPIRDTGVIGTVYFWGAQLEAGAYATSYIPTTSASVTRNADTFTLSNVFTNNMSSSAGGTWFVELRNNRVLTRDTPSNGLCLLDSSLSSFGFRIKTYVNARLAIAKVIAGGETGLYVTTTDTCKIAIKWNGTTADIFENGVKVIAATAFTPTNMEALVGVALDVPKYINDTALYNTPISDAECIAITTL